MTNCTFSGNNALFGGGLANFGGSPAAINCVFSGNTADQGGGGVYDDGGTTSVINSVMWGDSPDEIAGPGNPIAMFSVVQGGFPGTGNIDTDPDFVDPVNADFRLSPGSPCIDAGDNTAVPVGIDTDLDGNPRFVDDPDTPDSGNGDPPIVDMGAFEFQGTSCPWDCGGDNDGNVGINDFLALLAQWGGPGACDFDGGNVGINDFLDLLANWGPCP